MNNLYILLLVIITCSCSDKSKINCLSKKNNLNLKDSIQKKGNFTIKLVSINEKEYYESVKMNGCSLDTNDIEKYKSQGEIKIKNKIGHVIRYFKDTLVETDETDQKLFEVIGVFKTINTILINAQYYETGECLLINNETGKLTYIFGVPKISPNNKYFFCCSSALGYDEIMPNGFQIWEIHEKNNFTLLNEVHDKMQTITDFYWIGDRKLLLKMKNINNSIFYMKLSF